jgi:hypothetical protein
MEVLIQLQQHQDLGPGEWRDKRDKEHENLPGSANNQLQNNSKNCRVLESTECIKRKR